MAGADPQGSPKPPFPRLPPGKTSRTPEETAEHQRARLVGAMVDAVGRNGFAATTLREVVGLAGVSNRAFYEHFESMQDCFLAAFDEIAMRTGERSALAFISESEFPQRLKATLDTYRETIISEPTEAHLMLVDLIALGAEGVERRQRVAGAFETMISQSFVEEPQGEQIPELAVRGIVGGIQRIAYRRVRSGAIENLGSEFDQIHRWALCYLRPPGEKAAARERAELSTAVGEEPDLGVEWDEQRRRGRRGGAERRERIIRAAMTVAGERGYMSLSIPAITRAARVSNETFYEYFSSTQEAFLAAVDTLGGRILERVAAALAAEQSWPAAVRAGLGALLGFLAENPGLAQLLFIEALGAGPATLERVDLMLDTLSEMFRLDRQPGPDGEPLPVAVVESIVGGPFFIVQREVSEHRVTALAELLGELTAFVLTPYGEA